ncbi:hypothetical protein RIF29_04129 [Crotalaria pallida]|uniref:Uncharacterized protein n=1 Tax=Crotalaria pallida TaxID=3830 RepID=A0AAN9J1Q3_CROPI
MARKRGRPPKTPVSKTKEDDRSASKFLQDVPVVDAYQLDVDDLAEIENLTPKQALAWMEKLDVLRSKIKAKAVVSLDNVITPEKSANPSPASSERVLETPSSGANEKTVLQEENVVSIEIEGMAGNQGETSNPNANHVTSDKLGTSED